MTRGELVAKFQANASHIDSGQARALVDLLLELGALTSVAALMEALGRAVVSA